MLVQHGNVIYGRTERWRSVLDCLGMATLGLASAAPFLAALHYDGTRDLRDGGFYLLIVPFALVGMALFGAAWHFGLRRVIQPDELTLTLSSLAITRSGRHVTYPWSDLAAARGSDASRSGGSVTIKDLRTGKNLHINMSYYGCRGDETADIIQSIRAGQLMDSRDWRGENGPSKIDIIVVSLIFLIPIGGFCVVLFKL